MRFFSGLSFGGRRVRAGVSSSGRPWLGARAPVGGGAYLGVRSSESRQPLAAYQDTQAPPVLGFKVADDGRVFLGDAELDVADLKEVVRASDEAKVAARILHPCPYGPRCHGCWYCDPLPEERTKS